MTVAVPTLYAMCGLAFSGKSMLARRIADKLDAELVSLDAINHERGLRGGEGMTEAQWEETSMIAVARLAALMKTRRVPVVLDDTLSHRFLRDRYRGLAAEHDYAFVLVLVDTPLDVIEDRRRMNENTQIRHRVRDEVFAPHRAGFQYPTDDESAICLRRPDEIETWLMSL